MDDYEVRIEMVRREFRVKGMIVECIQSGGAGICEAGCPMFGNCWVKGREKEETYLNSRDISTGN